MYDLYLSVYIAHATSGPLLRGHSRRVDPRGRVHATTLPNMSTVGLILAKKLQHSTPILSRTVFRPLDLMGFEGGVCPLDTDVL